MTSPRSTASSARTAATSASATSRTASKLTIRAVWGRKTTSLVPVTNSPVIGTNALIAKGIHSMNAFVVQVPLLVKTALEMLSLSN